MPRNAAKTIIHHSNQCHTGPKLHSRDWTASIGYVNRNRVRCRFHYRIIHPQSVRKQSHFIITGPYSTSSKTTMQSKMYKTTPTTMLQQESASQGQQHSRWWNHLNTSQQHAQYHLQDHQKPQTSSKQVQINENNQCKFIQSQYWLESHHFYLHCQHKHSFQDHQQLIAADTHTFQDHQPSIAAENQPLQDNQCPTTTDFTTKHSSQDHHQSTTTFISNHMLQDHSTINRYHYYHYHHTRFQHSQDHTHRYHVMSHNKYTIYQLYYLTHHNIALHRNKKTEDAGYYKDIRDKTFYFAYGQYT